MGRQRKETRFFAKIAALLKGCSQTICTAQYEMHTGLLMAPIENESFMPYLLPFQVVFASKLLRLCLPVKLFFQKKEGSSGSLYSLSRAEHSVGPAVGPCQSYVRLSYLSRTVALLCCGCSSLCRVVLAERANTR